MGSAGWWGVPGSLHRASRDPLSPLKASLWGSQGCEVCCAPFPFGLRLTEIRLEQLRADLGSGAVPNLRLSLTLVVHRVLQVAWGTNSLHRHGMLGGNQCLWAPQSFCHCFFTSES